MKDLKLSLIVSALDRATSPLRKIGGGLKGLEERAEGLAHGFKKLSLTGFLGGGLVIGGAIETGRKLFETTDKVAEMGEGFLVAGKKAGIGAEAIQKIGFAVKQLGGDADGLGTVFFRFETHLANAAARNKESIKALGLVGIGTKDIRRLTADPVEALMRLSDGIKNLPNAAARSKVVMDMFGRGGAQIMPLLLAGRAEIQKYVAQFVASGAMMSQADSEASETFIQKKNLMMKSLQALQIRVGVGLIPVMSRLVDRIADVGNRMKPQVVGRFTASMDKLIDQLPALITLGGQFLDFVAAVVPKFLAWTDKVGGLKTVLTVLGFIMAGEFVANAVGAIGALLGVFKALKAVSLALKLEAFASFAAGLAGLVPGAIAATVAFIGLDLALGPVLLVVGLFVGAVALLALGAYALVKHWKQIGPFFSGLWAGAVGALHKTWEGVTSWFAGLLKGVETVFTGAWARIMAGMPDWLKGLLNIRGISVNAPRTGLAPPVFTVPGASPIHGRAAKTNAAAPRALRRPAAYTQPARRTDLHLHITGDAAPRVKTIKATGADLTIHRGIISA